MAAWTFRTDASNSTDIAGAIVSETNAHSTGSQYCEAAENSTGTSAWMAVRRLGWFPGASHILDCSDMPLNTFGHFIVSNQQGFVANPGGSQGHLCLQGAIGRFNGIGEILNSGSDGSYSLFMSSNSLPSPFGSVAVMSGETWNYQSWFRESGGNSNFSNAVEVTYD